MPEGASLYATPMRTDSYHGKLGDIGHNQKGSSSSSSSSLTAATTTKKRSANEISPVSTDASSYEIVLSYGPEIVNLLRGIPLRQAWMYRADVSTETGITISGKGTINRKLLSPSSQSEGKNHRCGPSLSPSSLADARATSKSVEQYDLDTGRTIATFDSQADAARAINIRGRGHIGECVRGKRNHAGGYGWRTPRSASAAAIAKFKNKTTATMALAKNGNVSLPKGTARFTQNLILNTI